MNESIRQLSVVVVSWNVRDLLLACLASLQLAISKVDAEVILVDNASADATADAVEQLYPFVRTVRTNENRGFAYAANLGMALARGRYLLLLNPDTIVSESAITGLLAFMANHAAVGACGPRLLRPDGRPQADQFGRDLTLLELSRVGLSRRLLGREAYDWNTSKVLSVDWISGACILARAEVLEQVGSLDSTFFAYLEDCDWCLRMRQKGWEVCFVPEVSITHIGGQSMIKNPKALVVYHESLIYYYQKHYSRLANGILRLVLYFYARR